MRVEYRFDIGEIEVPRFSVEAVEGIGKLFSLATLVMNVLDTKAVIEIVFHGLNPEDPERKISAFEEILTSIPGADVFQFEPAAGGRVQGSSSYYRWVRVTRG